MSSHFGQVIKSETLLNIHLRITEKKNKRLTFQAIHFSIEDGYARLREFFKTPLFVRVFYMFLML